MRIVEPSWYIRPLPFQTVFSINSGIELLRQVEFYARISHRSEDAATEDSWKRIIETVVLQKGDWSVTEHEKVTVVVEVDRGITHEWVRHRIGSYTQESTRFVNYLKKGIRFIYPTDHPNVRDIMDSAFSVAENWYNKLVDDWKVPPQIARAILPNATAALLVVTYNLRVWRWFFLMRTTLEAHPQMKQITIPLLQKFKEAIPLLYDDIEPNQRQAHNLRLPK